VSLLMNTNKTIGLIGGNGSFASAYFYKLLLDKAVRDYGAKCNDDFPHIILDSIPVPDFISDEKCIDIASKILQKSIKIINKHKPIGVAILCNTIHFLNPKVPNFVSLVEMTCDEVIKRKYKKVGVLATPTTIKHDLYGKFLRRNRIEVIYPDKLIQKYHEKIIRNVIANRHKTNNLEKLTRDFIGINNLDGVVLGCTELPLVFPTSKFNNVVDCLDVLANELLFRYY
jgi:aspartate racemase